MSQRNDFSHLSPELTRKFYDFSVAVRGSTIEHSLKHLVDLRASQLNGCAFCVDMHVKEARILGERELRLHHVAIWRESPLFSARERAALEWTEALTNLSAHGVPDDIYDAVRAQFSEKELSDLTFVVVAINGWNRASVAYRRTPGAMDEAYGLTKANLV